MDYTAALHRLMGLTDWERMVGPGTHRPRYDLARMRTLAQRLGDPQDRVPAVHVTGTKGKGSTSALITSALGQQGYAVGLYTSPHLHSVRERIRLGLEPVEEALFTELVKGVWPALESVQHEEELGQVTVFEMLTAMAFQCFVDTHRELQVLEVGLGGMLDATNIIDGPRVCVLTSISLDHTQILGSTLEAIAGEKCGIIKSGATVVCAPQAPEVMEVVEEACRERGAELVRVAEEYRWTQGAWDLHGQWFDMMGPRGLLRLWTPLLGAHQLENAACAAAAVEALTPHGFAVTDASLARGMAEVRWPGRLEVLGSSPLIVVDGAHNPYSMTRLAEAVRYHFESRECILVMGCTRGHDMSGLVTEAAKIGPSRVVASPSRHPRAAPPEELRGAFAELGVAAEAAETVAEAVERALALATPESVVLATGSLFTVAEVREHLLGISPELYPELQPDNLLPRTT